MSDIRHYDEIFDYLSAPLAPPEAHPTVVFGRNDARVAHAAGELAAANLAETIVISGGVGKDTGDLLQRGYNSEADFLDKQLRSYANDRGFSLPPVTVEEKATNGGENAAFSLKILSEQGVAMDGLISVAHATSSLRLAEGLRFAAQKNHGIEPVIYRVPTAYPFDPTNPKDQEEAGKELLRLADWPGEGKLLPRDDVPENLIDFARDRHGDAPKPIAPWQSAVLRYLPKNARLGVINFAARHNRK